MAGSTAETTTFTLDTVTQNLGRRRATEVQEVEGQVVPVRCWRDVYAFLSYSTAS